jgi:hypothetical protein
VSTGTGELHTGVAGGSGPSISQLNPLELMARADRGQNNAFRLLTGYSLAKREAVKRMGQNMGRADRAQLAITNIMQMPPREQLRALAKDQEVLEEHADAITDLMGDYTTMTAFERKALNRAVMFMPYLRYSLRLLFWTLPAEHLAMTGLLAELGSMKADELAELFGEDNLPWNSGKLYFDSDGDLKSIDLRKANPILNAPIEAVSRGMGSQLVGVAPPWVGWIFDQLAMEAGFSGKDWKVHGRATPYNFDAGLPWQTRARIAFDDTAGIFFPYRVAERLTQEGPQGDDSFLFSERPTVYKDTTRLAELQRKFGQRRERFEEEHESLIGELFPLLPEPDRSAAEAREERILDRADRPARKRPNGYFGTTQRRRAKGYFGTTQRRRAKGYFGTNR